MKWQPLHKMTFFPKRPRNSIITVLTIVLTTLITTIENTNSSNSFEYSSSPSTWSSNESQSNSTAQAANSDGSVEEEAQAESQSNSTTPTANSDISTKKEAELLLKSLQQMRQNRDEINNLYRRSLAENDNLDKRYQKKVEEAKIFGIQSFGKDLLDIADILHKAIESVPKEEVTDNNPHLKNLYEGLTMAESELKTVFIRHGLEVFNPLGEKFDANFHEALFEQEVEGKPPGIVFVVSKPGCKIRGRIIRPALVGVTK